MRETPSFVSENNKVLEDERATVPVSRRLLSVAEGGSLDGDSVPEILPVTESEDEAFGSLMDCVDESRDESDANSVIVREPLAKGLLVEFVCSKVWESVGSSEYVLDASSIVEVGVSDKDELGLKDSDIAIVQEYEADSMLLESASLGDRDKVPRLAVTGIVLDGRRLIDFFVSDHEPEKEKVCGRLLVGLPPV